MTKKSHRKHSDKSWLGCHDSLPNSCPHDRLLPSQLTHARQDTPTPGESLKEEDDGEYEGEEQKDLKDKDNAKSSNH
jgi:hypothetical protein